MVRLYCNLSTLSVKTEHPTVTKHVTLERSYRGSATSGTLQVPDKSTRERREDRWSNSLASNEHTHTT